jgi:DNA-binding GntR family transcriptional regulator
MPKSQMDKIAGGLSAKVYQRIRSMILSGELAAGASVTELGLAQQCGVSRTPVREALHQLELEELVELIPNKGVVIRGISPEDICDIFRIRSMLEGSVAERAALRGGDEDIKRLREIVELTEFYIDRGQMQKLQVMDGQFHQLIYEMSGSRMFRRVLKDMHYYIGLTRGASWQSEGRADDSVEEHRAILEAIEKRDGAKAREEMSRHVCNALSNVMDHHLQDYRAKQDN